MGTVKGDIDRVFDAIDAYDEEKAAWRLYQTPSGEYIVDDRDRYVRVLSPVAEPNTSQFQQHYFATVEDARFFVHYQSMEAALRAGVSPK